MKPIHVCTFALDLSLPHAEMVVAMRALIRHYTGHDLLPLDVKPPQELLYAHANLAAGRRINVIASVFADGSVRLELE